MGRARSTLERITVIAGLVAAMTVASTLAAALTLALGPTGGSPDGPSAGRSGDGEVGAAGAGARHVVRAVPGSEPLRVGLALPDAAWSAAAPEAVAGYRRQRGEALVVTGPVFFRRGWCADDPRWSSRAFAGVVPRVRDVPPRAAGVRLSRRWAQVVTDFVGERDAASASHSGQGSVRARARASPVRVQGHAGWLTTRSVTLTSAGPCLPPRVSVDVLSLDVGGEVVAVVVVRDVGVPDALTRTGSIDFLRRTQVLAQSLRNRT
ncbi:hypothetical protein [Nocardioides pacificus]